ncbi:MAG TPA: FecR domain-containing protein [Pyrinomonadaceae bacterium]|nr:FecR domain-containing protein [Pyrinomonadaceae bacterium]
MNYPTSLRILFSLVLTLAAETLNTSRAADGRPAAFKTTTGAASESSLASGKSSRTSGKSSFTPGEPSLASGELSLEGRATVDGLEAVSGMTIFSGSEIATTDDSRAVVSLGRSGRVELLPRSRLRFDFAGAGVEGRLEQGGARFSTTGEAPLRVETAGATVSAGRFQPSLFVVDVSCGDASVSTHLGRVVLRDGASARSLAAGESASAGRRVAAAGMLCAAPQNPVPPPQQNGRSRKKLFGWLLAAGGAFAALTALVITNRNEGEVFDPCEFGGPIIVSPFTDPCGRF